MNRITEKWRFHVVSKKRIYGDYSLLEEKRKRYRNHLIVYLLVFIPCILALIGFNVLLLYASTNFFLAILVAAFGQYVFFINFFLIVFDSLMGLFVILSTRGFISTKRKMNQFEERETKQSVKEDTTEKNEIYESLTSSEEKRKKRIKFLSLTFILFGIILYSFIAYYVYSFNPDIPYNYATLIVIAPLVVASIAYGIYEKKKRNK